MIKNHFEAKVVAGAGIMGLSSHFDDRCLALLYQHDSTGIIAEFAN